MLSSNAGFWWTLAGAATNCERCGGGLAAGSKIAYRHSPRKTLCPSCVRHDGLNPRTSKRLRKAGETKGATK